MPRRSGRTSLANSVHFSTPEQSAPLPQLSCLDNDLLILRTHWKWASFTQFITTFSPLLNMADVTVNDIETDLVSGSRKVISRVVQRLMYTLTYDRKISVDNWQSALRKQYMKRDPSSNPLGSEPKRERTAESREPSPETIGDEEHKTSSEKETLDVSTNPLPQMPSETMSEISRAASQEFEDKDKQIGDHVSVDWFDLPILAKLESLHLITEWQFQNPTRLRILMRSDDELATWRHEPIGYDSKKNAYWLIGGDRLWIQRVPPKPAKTLKRKRQTETRKVEPTLKSKSKSKPFKRQRILPNGNFHDDTPNRAGRGRAAKLQAKIKLDAQAKELAALNQQGRSGRHSTRSLRIQAKPVTRPQGTRLSARLRGTHNNEWQSIPDDWLNESSNAEQQNTTDDELPLPQSANKTTGEQDDSISELTELSDESDEPEVKTWEPAVTDEVESSTVKAEKHSVKHEEVEASNDSFNEWETICVTLEEWEHIAERFEKATHYLEKALYKYLSNELVPSITEALREEEKKKRMEEAIVHRKRSSRLALREIEREEVRLAKQREAEEAEKMSRTRRLELRRQREEEERTRREQAREQRRKEREAREVRRQAELGHENESSDNEKQESAVNKYPLPPPTPDKLSPQPHKGVKPQTLRQRSKPTVNGIVPKALVKKSDWELDCEICRKRGINLDDRTPMMSCGKCFKWQHIACHDLADERAGRSKRNWDSVEFICQQCRSRMFADVEGANVVSRDPRYNRSVAQGVSLSSPYNSRTPYQTYSAQSFGTSQISQPPTNHHIANGGYPHYAQSYNSVRAPLPDHYPNDQSYLPIHHYSQSPPTISFSHYQPREGGFSANIKSQSPYQARQLDLYDQHPRVQQHVPYSELRSSANQKLPAPSTQSVWSLGTATPPGNYTTPYHSTVYSNGAPRRDLQLQPNMKPGPSSSNDHSLEQLHPNSQFRYHSTT